MMMRKTTDDALEVSLGLRLLDRATDTLAVVIIPVLNRLGDCGSGGVGDVIRTTPSKMPP